jgi:hypothetical protein
MVEEAGVAEAAVAVVVVVAVAEADVAVDITNLVIHMEAQEPMVLSCLNYVCIQERNITNSHKIKRLR